MQSIEIRESLPDDMAAIETLYPDAFPDEDLLPLVKELLKETPVILSLVAITRTSVAGHAIFSTCSITGNTNKVALLGPLAVGTDYQRQGVGSALIRAGLQRLENDGVSTVFVLGDPAYYGRFGFARELDVMPPYRLPEEWGGAWQSINLGGSEPPDQGTLDVPQPWRQPVLWT